MPARNRKSQSGAGQVPDDVLNWDAAPSKSITGKLTQQAGSTRKEKARQQMYMKIGGVALVVILFFAYGWGARAREVNSWATNNGFNVVNATDYELRNKFAEFGIFYRGVDDYGQNVVQGTKGDLEFTSFDYAYTRAAVVRGKKKARIQRFEDIVITGAVIEVPNRNFPTLTIRPANYVAEWDLLRQLNNSVVPEEVAKTMDAEALRRFNDAYQVRTAVLEDRVYEVLTSDVMALINSFPAQFVFEFQGSKLLVYQEHIVDSSVFDSMIESGVALINKMEDIELPELPREQPAEESPEPAAAAQAEEQEQAAAEEEAPVVVEEADED